MGKNESGKFERFAKIIREVEHELADWKYYQAINGKSAAATLFFFFLKFMDDMYGESVGIIGRIKSAMEHKDFIPQKYVYEYVLKIVSQWNDSGDILLQYIRRIDFEKIPCDFISVLYEIEAFDFCNEDICNDFIFAMLALYVSLYDEIGLKNRLHSGELYTMIAAGELLDCQDGMSVYDFSSGTGGLLAFGGARDCTVYAQERDFEKSVAAYIFLKMLKTKKVYIKVGDMIEEPITVEKAGLLFDRIISAPPARKKYSEGGGLKYWWRDEFEYFYPLQESEFWVYARHMIKKLKDGGRAILVAPVSVLSKEGLIKRDRERFLMDRYIEGVVQLPGSMLPDINKLCFIILAKEETRSKQSKIYMADFSGRKGEENIYTDANEVHVDNKRICQIVNNREVIAGVSDYIDVDIILNNNLNLTPAIYLRDITEMMERRYKVEDMIDRQKKLIEQYYESETRLNKAIRNYYRFWGKKHNKTEMDES